MKTDGSHWYDRKTGESRHTIIGKNGVERPTTLRDAKKFGYLPSCTTILRILAKPELDVWKQKQVLLASLTLPRLVDETDESYCERIIEDAFKQVDDAADLGTRVHKAIENHFQGQPYDKELTPYIEGVDKWVKESGVTFLQHELRVKTDSYAGTLDGIIQVKGRNGKGVIDFKTRKSKPEYPMKPWNTEPMQIAAYALASAESYLDFLDMFGVNVFVSTTQIGRVECKWYDSEDLYKNSDIFHNIRRVWEGLNGYNPSQYQFDHFKPFQKLPIEL